MDEEDIREAEESRALDTSKEFAGFGTEHDIVRKTAAIDIFRPMGETIGSRLLQKMGWRKGNGIGPRVRRVARLGEDDDCGETGETHLFAPDDAQVISFTRKTDYKGLGYEGELQEKEDSTNGKSRTRRPAPSGRLSDEDDVGPLFAARKKPASTTKRTGFGVGVLNDDGSEDEDPYSMGPKISYNKSIGDNKKVKTKPKPLASSANPLLQTKPTFISKRLASLKGALRKCHDGRLPPDGFVLADELDSLGRMTLQEERYKPVEVPTAWKSSLSSEMATDPNSDFVSTIEAAKASHLSAKARASLLGESQLPGKSVFDFLTPAARDRLAAASGRQNLPAAGNESAPAGHESPKSPTEKLQSLVPRLEQEVAQQALNRGVGGWMPYAEDENKRSRYRTYLEIQAGLRSKEDIPPRADHMKQDDWVLEMQEFARAAEVFKPISGLMASRFTSSTNLPHGQGETSGEAAVGSLLSKARGKPQDPAEAAAKLGMFGPMTRSIVNFYPSRLLCKRFGVSMPTHAASADAEPRNGRPSGAPEPDFAATQFRSFASAGYQHDETSEVNQMSAEARVDQQPSPPIQKDELGVMDPDRNEALEQQRPGQAVFKAIFGSDDEDD
jgi:G patch domain-containing protein 1